MTDQTVQAFYSGSDASHLVPSMQGQDLVPLISTDNAMDPPLCQVKIVMHPGKVSTPHVHYKAHVLVHLLSSGPMGVLTYAGEELEERIWLRMGGTLWIPPGIPHVAVYPRSAAQGIIAFALETRTVPAWRADVTALDTLEETLRTRLREDFDVDDVAVD
jgi:uncharacterized RmlC-like cupin family protein